MTGLLALVKKAGRLALDVLFPSGVCCLHCGEASDGELLCADCRKRLDAMRLREPVCPVCGAEMPYGEPCPCRCAPEGAACTRSVWRYEHAAKRMVALMKFSAVRDAAVVLAEGLAETAAAMELPADIVVTSVATTRGRKRERGIDHGMMLAQLTAEKAGLPYASLLKRRPGGHTQRGLNRNKRLTNLEGRFTAKVEPGRPVLLVDDVLTTGATADVCVRALRQAGSGPVYVLTATRVTR